MGVEARPGGGPAERDLSDPPERGADPVCTEPDLGRIARELLPESDRDGVHQVGAPGLDEVLELIGLALERHPQAVESGQQLGVHLAKGSEVNGGREDVVRGLAHVDVVVRVGLFAGELGDHLVRVHVRGGP